VCINIFKILSKFLSGLARLFAPLGPHYLLGQAHIESPFGKTIHDHPWGAMEAIRVKVEIGLSLDWI